ncbi:restriction endonuclease [Leeuwenhoekiella marinoflava]|uniref:Response regulator receiver domain-containing protein n=2 Tax=Leeuwenhoekiella marinoflava TaxID=988 RepID=A0A4Q0PIQ6_9FLAO|nr:restriction endonuclease [Leeuwenhoekiella marinoflava]RXG26888.1 response regulator receiver domain-containing protein [Leeuwenhoekiella marinoflava]SHF40260.1 Response regulator receiver domain-containing protein [Leeuwenhoekiella marinoflava DSM 3653]
MKRSILIIDDVKEQAIGLVKGLQKQLPLEYNLFSAFEEDSIIESIENRYFSLAIVDLRMDDFSFNGIELINKIIDTNPFAKILIVSAFKGEYLLQLKDLFLTGRIVNVLDKEDYDIWIPKLVNEIETYHNDMFNSPDEINNALLEYYSNAKNETDSYSKGEKFEHFVSLLFQSIGFNSINKRIIDKSLNEVDLIIRNEIADPFLNKFGKYILVECKNKPKDKVDKNTFIVFSDKLKHTNGLAELGIIATTGYLTRNTYIEAVRGSGDLRKIIFISNHEFEKLILSKNKLEMFKSIIDSQVKDN